VWRALYGTTGDTEQRRHRQNYAHGISVRRTDHCSGSSSACLHTLCAICATDHTDTTQLAPPHQQPVDRPALPIHWNGRSANWRRRCLERRPLPIAPENEDWPWNQSWTQTPRHGLSHWMTRKTAGPDKSALDTARHLSAWQSRKGGEPADGTRSTPLAWPPTPEERDPSRRPGLGHGGVGESVPVSSPRTSLARWRRRHFSADAAVCDAANTGTAKRRNPSRGGRHQSRCEEVPSVSTSEHQPTLSAFSSSIDDGVGRPGLNGQGANRRGGLLRFINLDQPRCGGDERSMMRVVVRMGNPKSGAWWDARRFRRKARRFASAGRIDAPSHG
jgi:hypothetical protein